MTYNFHTHTHRCHHAVGEDRAYIEAAIRGGITQMGFSDHMPMVFPGSYRSGYRVEAEEVAAYMAQLRALQEEYRNDITLYIGFEAEYYPRFFEQTRAWMRELQADYLLLGQHFIRNELPPDGFYIGNPFDDVSLLTTYVDEVIEAMHSGAFTYVAHPDIPQYYGPEEGYETEMRRLCRAAVKTGTPLEINLLGIRDKRWYPCDRFWRIAGEEQVSVVLGCDAHDPAAACDVASLPRARDILDRYGLQETCPTLIKP